MSKNQKRLAQSIIEFLNQAIQDRTVTDVHSGRLQVAIQSIGEAFGINPSDQAQSQKLSVKPTSLQSIFDVYLQTCNAAVRSTAGLSPQVAEPTPQSPPSGPAAVPNSSAPSTNDKADAEKFKQVGDSQVSRKDYDAAIESYSTAIALDPTNPAYYSNRGAAHSHKGHHLSAVSDAEVAISVDANFVKAYQTLGHALHSYGNLIFKASSGAFERGLKVDPNDESLRSSLQIVRTKMTDNYAGGIPDLSNVDVPQLMASEQQMADSFLRNSAITLTNMVNDLRNLAS